jgi:hypothetical protein
LSGTLTGHDVDTGHTLSYGIAGTITTGDVQINGITYNVAQDGAYGTVHLNSSTGAYLHVPDPAKVNALSTRRYTI